MSAPSPSKAPTACAPSKTLNQFNQPRFRILLLEGVSTRGVALLEAEGFDVETHRTALDPAVLADKIRGVHVLGIRSKTQLTSEILSHADQLLAVGCFCIGTNQVDLDFAASHGIAVFNSPFSNSRSVAELVTGLLIALSRRIVDASSSLHTGILPISPSGSVGGAAGTEIAGKTLGIVGYGHIGSQLSVIAESLGLRVIFHDVTQIMPLGTARPVASLDILLAESDFVSLHVPATDVTELMIGAPQLAAMKRGSILINASRGSVVDIPALAAALKSGHLSGAAVDVYPSEPFGNGAGFVTELQGCPNTILTPHIGGSTEEAQAAIGVEVASSLIKFLRCGTSTTAVNFPHCDLRDVPADPNIVRVLNVHRNVPGVLRQINKILSAYNIERQISDSLQSFAYLMADIRVDTPQEYETIFNSLNKIHENVLTRLLH